ncbi:MAG: hypothetical protein ACM34M_14635 [Ignavibacteria bacterium]
MKYFTKEELGNLYTQDRKAWKAVVKLFQGAEATKKNEHPERFERVMNNARNDYFNACNEAVRNLKEDARLESNAEGNF